METPSLTSLLDNSPKAVPLFVYGTLKRGGALHEFYLSAIVKDVEAGVVDGYRLVTNGSYPYMVPAEGQRTYGEIMWVNPRTAQFQRTVSMEVQTGYTFHMVDVESSTLGEKIPCLSFVWERRIPRGTSPVPFNNF